MKLWVWIFIVATVRAVNGLAMWLPPRLVRGFVVVGLGGVGRGGKPPRAPPSSAWAARDDRDGEHPLKNTSSLFSSNVASIAITTAGSLLARVFVLEPRFIPSISMFPTLRVGDHVLVDKISKRFRRPRRRDVVVFSATDQCAALMSQRADLVKRVVAVEGDCVEMCGGDLWVNGQHQVEAYAEADCTTLPPTRVPGGSLFVLGDNRRQSCDSRSWGMLPIENLIGRAVVCYWPPHRVGWLHAQPS